MNTWTTDCTVVPAKNPWQPQHGELVICWCKPGSGTYIETPGPEVPNKQVSPSEHVYERPIEGQVLPLCLVSPNPWRALQILGIDTQEIMLPYTCPYTGLVFYGLVPSCLVSSDVGRYADKIRYDKDYILDHEYHREMWKDRVFDLQDVARVLLGTGYTHGTGINDGSRSLHQTKVNLSNGDYLWCYLWLWHNK